MPLSLLGKVNSVAFQKAKAMVEASSMASEATIQPLFPSDYEAALATLCTEVGGKAWGHTGATAAYSEDGFIGDEVGRVRADC